MIFLFQAEDGIRDLVRSRGLGDVYKRQLQRRPGVVPAEDRFGAAEDQEAAALQAAFEEVERLSLIHI